MSKHISQLDKWSKITLSISLFLIVFSFFAPAIFTFNSVFDFTKTGGIGDTMSGIMNPFIAIAGVGVTFLAFYMQFVANQSMKDDFENQKKTFKINQFENQFYEMLRLHKENVNELYVCDGRNEIRGRRVFDSFLAEFESCYYIISNKSDRTKVDEDKKNIKIAYTIFYYGLYDKSLDEIRSLKDEQTQNLTRFSAAAKSKDVYNLGIVDGLDDFNIRAPLRYALFEGYYSQLNCYYRHLYQTVKFVVNTSIIEYEEKRKYLRILRAQLSSTEQAMLFYNWYSGRGVQWESDLLGNKYLTDYRMIHNVHPGLLIESIKLENVFNFKKYQREKNRVSDSLFEYQDWEVA